MVATPPALDISLFDRVQEHSGGSLPAITCTKSTLIHLSHTLEDIIQTEHLSGMFFAGFQESAHWLEVAHHYKQLAAQDVCIFAGGSIPPGMNVPHCYIELSEGDTLRQEWFLLILSNRFSVLLNAKDKLLPVEDDLAQEFDTFWTFDTELINVAVDTLEAVIAHYHPQRLIPIQSIRTTYDPGIPDVTLVSRFMQSFVQHEERLHTQLQWQKHLTDTLLASIPHSLYVCQIEPSQQSQTIYASPNLATLTGYSLAEMGDIWGFWAREGIHPDDYQKIQDARPLRFENGGQGVLEYRFVRADGSVILLQDTMTIEVDPATQVKTIYGVIEDITNQRKHEIEMRDQERLRIELQKERELNTLRMRFMTNISHEFRTPLATILSSVEILVNYADRINEDSRMNKLEIILNQAMHLRQMLDDIAILLDDEIGRLGYHPVPLPVCQFVDATIREFEMRRKTTHQITFEHNVNDAEYLADGRLLDHIITHLLANAVNYSSPGSKITCTLMLRDTQMTFVVADEGIGIPEADIKHLFEPFFRGSNIGTVGGTGLGLSMARECAQLHGGEIALSSVVGEGTTVTVTIPMVPA